ncbi:MAG: hypothetical protein ABR936_15135 [Bacteroidota bacterium]|jgi:predicted nucleic acid-binding Zn ribbon protein
MSTKKCPFCAEEIQIDAKKCKHCGEILDSSLKNGSSNAQQIKPKKKRIGFWGIIGIIILVVIGFNAIKSGIEKFSKETTGDNSRIPPLDATAQMSFLSLNYQYSQQYQLAKNDIQRSSSFNSCNADRGNFLSRSDYCVVNWVGRIVSIQTDQGGDKVCIKVENIFKNMNVSYFSQPTISFSDQALIRKGTKVYNQVAQLTESQLVKFSGRFFESSSRGIEETSLTESGCLNTPEFLFEFEDIQATK